MTCFRGFRNLSYGSDRSTGPAWQVMSGAWPSWEQYGAVKFCLRAHWGSSLQPPPTQVWGPKKSQRNHCTELPTPLAALAPKPLCSPELGSSKGSCWDQSPAGGACSSSASPCPAAPFWPQPALQPKQDDHLLKSPEAATTPASPMLEPTLPSPPAPPHGQPGVNLWGVKAEPRRCQWEGDKHSHGLRSQSCVTQRCLGS